MREAFLHYIWKNKIFDQENIFIEGEQKIEILFPGFHNENAGPDFLEAKLRIGDILWVGNVEIHIKSSDWYAHGHEQNPAYDNMILHVVYNDDMPVYNKNNQQIPTLNISKLIDREVLKKYNCLIKNKAILKCQNHIHQIDPFLIFQYKYKLYIERLENKNKSFLNMLKLSGNDWEQVLYSQLLKYFGGSVNKGAFEDLALLLPFEIFRKYRDNILSLEALLLGVGGLLMEERKNCSYYQQLKKEFVFLQHKHNLQSLRQGSIRFHRMRPQGFPTIRLAQFAKLYYAYLSIFDAFMNLNSPEEAYEHLEVTASGFWDTHYNFEKTTKSLPKKISKSFIDRLLINVIIPLKFAYQKNDANFTPEHLISFIESIAPEKNRIIDTFTKIGVASFTALDTQAMIELYEKYCSKEKCLECEIGHFLLNLNNIQDDSNREA